MMKPALRTFSVAVMWGIPFALLGFQASALFDLSDGRFSLFMDEQISFDGVKAIYISDGPLDFARNVAAGHDNDLRYGRAFWNVLAVAGLPAFYFAGDTGLIVMNRVSGLLMQYLSYFFLARSLRLSSCATPLFIAFLAALPTHLHYSAMPKPEPLLLLVLALTLNRLVGSKFQIDKTSALLLGFATGVKISFLPILIGILALALVASRDRVQAWTFRVRKIITLSAWFLTGWVLCTPIIFAGIWPLLLVAGLVWGGLSKAKFARGEPNAIGENPKLIIATNGALLGVIAVFLGLASYVDERLLNPGYTLTLWWNWNFGQAGLGGVSESSISNWMATTLATMFSGSALLLIAHSILLFSLGAVLVTLRKAPVPLDNTQLKDRAKVTITILGLAFLAWASIVFTVSRNWGFYLHPAAVLFWTAQLGLIGLLLESNKISRLPRVTRPLRIVSAGLAGLSIAFFSLNLEDSLRWHNATSSRTASEGYQNQLANYEATTDFLHEEWQSKQRMLNVTVDPSVFQPDSNDRWIVHRYWVNIPWDSNTDIIVLGSTQLEVARESGHLVASDSNECKVEPCFIVRGTLPSGGGVLVPLTENSPT